MALSVPVPHRLPRAGKDPISDAPTALALLGRAVARPWRTETILVPLDARQCSTHVIIIEGTDDLELMIEQVAPLLQRGGLAVERILVGTVHLRHPTSASEPGGVSWADRWLAAAAAADRAGSPLVEWFVLGPGGPWCPRDVLGVPPRWHKR